MSLWNKLFGRSPREANAPETEEPAPPPRPSFPEPIQTESKRPAKPKPELAPLAGFPEPVAENQEAFPPGLLPTLDLSANVSASALDILTYPDPSKPAQEPPRPAPPAASKAHAPAASDATETSQPAPGTELPKLEPEPEPKPKAKSKAKAQTAATPAAPKARPTVPGFAQIAKQARNLALAKDLAGALSLLREHLAQSPSAEAHAMLTGMLANHQQPEPALAQAEAGLEQFPGSARLCALKGEICLKLGQQAAAAAAFQLAVERDPPQAEAYQGLAELSALAQTWEDAAQRWQDCLERFPADARGPVWRGRRAEALLKLGEDTSAEQVYAELAEQHPDRALGEAGLAEVAASRANWQDAIQRWRRCLERFPKHAYAAAWRGQLANALMMDGQFQAAEAEYQALLKGSEHPEELREKLATLAENQGQFLAAAEQLRICLSLCPKHKRAVRWRIWTGNLLTKYGKFDAAEAEFQALADQYPSNLAGPQGLERVQRWREQAARKAAPKAKPDKAPTPKEGA
jgi:tetratricopeptide (TPR) repeat protein